jgi:hypothetical protein
MWLASRASRRTPVGRSRGSPEAEHASCGTSIRFRITIRIWKTPRGARIALHLSEEYRDLRPAFTICSGGILTWELVLFQHPLPILNLRAASIVDATSGDKTLSSAKGALFYTPCGTAVWAFLANAAAMLRS